MENVIVKSVLRQLGILVGIFGGITLVFFLGIYLFVFRSTFLRADPDEATNREFFVTEANFVRNKEDTEWFFAQNPEELTIESFDGLKLVAYNLRREHAKGTFVMMHGYHSAPLREFATLARFYYGLGYNIVLPYQRTHGESEGTYITFGVKERFDLRDWILAANEMYGTEQPIFLEGISMGCATVVMSLGLELPGNVRAAVADCGFTTPHDIIWKVLKNDKKLPLPRLIMIFGNFMANVLAGFDFNEYSTLTALNGNTIPVLFIHGTADTFVPVEMTLANFQYCTARKKLFLVEDAPHAISYFIDEKGYKEKVVDFCGL